uniref:TLC domain-containing protein n=1 Tax=Araucaria cunninghamii TaxID=56994 RepID=A0A0D6R7C7_ARACU
MIDWELEAYPVLGDLAMVPIFALIFPVVRLLLDRLVLERLGRLLLPGSFEGSNKYEQKKYKKRHDKFKESAWKCLYFLSAELFELTIIRKETWFTDTQKFWVGPGDQVWPDQKVKTNLKMTYMYAGGFFTYSFFAAIFWETRRSDFVLTVMHHVATVVLIMLSYVLRFARIGSVILAIHDTSDIIIEFSKMVKYIGYDVLPNITFVLFAISWISLRLIYFPIWIIWSTSYEVLLTLDKTKYKDGPIYYYVFNTLLICLLILNIYWGVLVYRVLDKQIRSKGKVVEDVRSDSEDEDEKND